MNRKGFTLVELLAVIVILAIVLAVAIPGISGIINSVKANAYKSQMQMIEDAAKKYMMDDFKYEDMEIGDTQAITLQQLYDAGIITSVKNPSTNEVFDPATIVYVTKRSDNKIEYTYENASDCRYNGKVCLKDKVVSDLVNKSQSYQGGTYYKGTNTDILNNYVWYSGQEYRIMGINSDGSIKMVTSLPVVAISWGPTGTADYANSYARKWLNILPDGDSLKDEYEGIFYKSLNRPDLIQDYPFCIGKQDPLSSTDATCSTKLTDKIGLMTWWEYKIAGPNVNGDGSYLDGNKSVTFLTGDARMDTKILMLHFSGSIYETDGTTYVSYVLNETYSATSIRPVINLKPSVSLLSGTGTSTDPYRFLGDESGKVSDYLNSRYAGEYLNFNGTKYRIVSNGQNGSTKITTDVFIKSPGGTAFDEDYTYFDRGLDSANLCENVSPYTNCTNHFDVNDGSGDYDGMIGHNIGYFLDSNASNSFYTSLGSTYQAYLDNATYYFGKIVHGADYKLGYTNAVSNGYGTQDLKVGMLQYGEMLAGSNVNGNFWLMNPWDSTFREAAVINYGFTHSSIPTTSDYACAIRPTLNLKSTIKIVSGNGTKQLPYEITN